MSFQWIIDNAETISMERKQVVASTTTRDGTTRSVSRGGQFWRFEVKLPDGPRWSQSRGDISRIEKVDRVNNGTFQINNAGHDWLSGYQGNSVNITGFVATIVEGSDTITLTTSPTTASGYKFKAGDLIQLGTSGKVYTVAADVLFNSNSVQLHRPVIESGASGVALRVGPNCVFSVRCVSFPKWTIFARDQISWDGPFVFHEVM